MPAKRALDQPSAGYPACAVPRDPVQGTSPAEANASDQVNREFAPTVVQTRDVQRGSLRYIDSHPRPAPPVLRRPRKPSLESAPSAQVVLQELLACLRGQLFQPFPAGKRVLASLTDLPVQFGGRGSPCDAVAAPGPP